MLFTFIDFKQAFDAVWRSGIWYKMLKNGIDGKGFTYIKNKLQGIKFLINMNAISSG
jgi:hypothetical protein